MFRQDGMGRHQLSVNNEDYADVVTSYDSTKIAKLRAFEGHISDNFLKVAK